MSLSKRPNFPLWIVIFIYTGIIYATLPLVSKWRKSLVEAYGYDVFDSIYWVFGVIFSALIIYIAVKFRGRELVKAFVSFAIIMGIYAYYLKDLKYSIERIHFLEYGLLGALIYIGFSRHMSRMPALLSGLCLSYLLGMGDEFIQYLLPNRVGEVRDCILNVFSAALGIFLVVTTFSRASRVDYVKTQGLFTLVFLGISVVITGFFIVQVHGFGYKHTTKNPGVIYSSLTLEDFDTVNKAKEISGKLNNYYQDEARRHLFQREFYCTNEWLGKTGEMYRKWDKCLMEHKVLEHFYPRFLKVNENALVTPLLEEYDHEFAQKVKEKKVGWDSAWYQDMLWANSDVELFESRVKSTLITSYEIKDLLFYCLLLLALIGWGIYRVNRT